MLANSAERSSDEMSAACVGTGEIAGTPVNAFPDGATPTFVEHFSAGYEQAYGNGAPAASEAPFALGRTDVRVLSPEPGFGLMRISSTPRTQT